MRDLLNALLAAATLFSVVAAVAVAVSWFWAWLYHQVKPYVSLNYELIWYLTAVLGGIVSVFLAVFAIGQFFLKVERERKQ